MDETLDKIKKEKEESNRLDSSEMDWSTFFGINENATEEEIDQMYEDQMC